MINIAYHCSDRICEQGKGEKPALMWENSSGEEKQFTYNDIRVCSNGIGAFLSHLGVKEGERACLFTDHTPELYIGLLGIQID